MDNKPKCGADVLLVYKLMGAMFLVILVGLGFAFLVGGC